MDYPPIKYREESLAETCIKTARNFADIFGSLVPIAGPAIAKSLEHMLGDIQERKMNEFVGGLSDYLAVMPAHIYKSEEFAEAMRKGISRYINEGNKEKRRLLLNMNKSFLSFLAPDKEKVFNLYVVFDELLGILSPTSLQALLQFEGNLGIKAKKSKINRYLLNTFEMRGNRSFLELVNQGLLEEDEGHKPVITFTHQPKQTLPGEDKTYKISTLAVVFLFWLRHELNDTEDAEG